MQHRLELDHLQCAGCADAVVEAVEVVQGVAAVRVDVSGRAVWLDLDGGDLREIIGVLALLGFTIAGTLDPVERALAAERTRASCLVARSTGEHGTPLPGPPLVLDGEPLRRKVSGG